MRLLGFVLVLMERLGDLEQLTARVLAGVTTEAELKSLDGLAAKVERGEGQLMFVDSSCVLSRVYRDTPISHWLLEVSDRSLNICRSSWVLFWILNSLDRLSGHPSSRTSGVG